MDIILDSFTRPNVGSGETAAEMNLIETELYVRSDEGGDVDFVFGRVYPDHRFCEGGGAGGVASV